MSNALKLTVPDGVPFIDFEREFDFPVADVFRAHREPELITQWLGPRGTNVDIDHYDFRSGGSYLYNHLIRSTFKLKTPSPRVTHQINHNPPFKPKMPIHIP